MLIKKPADIPSSEITDQSLYLNRRKFILGASAAGAALAVGVAVRELSSPAPAVANDKLAFSKSQFSASEKPTPYKDITNYNNYYEFGTDKYSPAGAAKGLKTRPWTVKVEGEVKKSKVLDIDAVLKPAPLEERIYRHRCVEGWSMVIPWVGFPLSAFLKQCDPTSKAKYVEMTTIYDPKQMPGQRSGVLDWPYVEGLRMDEAMHPLALLAVGLYGETLPNQNGAPIRLVVPWKYGFKGIKSIVRITLTDQQPVNTWQTANASEYGFYANVNPTVDHPRWTQAHERRLPSGLFSPNIRQTEMFNGYGEQVASLYTGLDLRKNY